MDLLDCLKRFAALETNAALMALGGDVCVSWRHYPKGDLVFGDGEWRAYYHAHPVGAPHDGDGAVDAKGDLAEHGHFHIFARAPGEERLAHVAALAVDSSGQPTRWFATNHWVTGEAWRDAETLARLSPATDPPGGDAAARWLGAMLRFFAPALGELLRERDRTAARLAAAKGASLPAVLADREIYVLADSAIDLAGALAAALSGEGDAESAPRAGA